MTTGSWTKPSHRLVLTRRKGLMSWAQGHACLIQHKSIADVKVSVTLLGRLGNAAATDRQATAAVDLNKRVPKN